MGPASQHPDSTDVAIRCDERTVTYAEFMQLVRRAANGLSARGGVEPGDRVALLLRNSLEFLVASFALASLGAGAIPLNWHWRQAEVAYVLRDSGAKSLIVHEDLWEAVAGQIPEGVRVIIVPSAPDGRHQEVTGAVHWDLILADASGATARRPEVAPMSIIYTSGTTGRPKGVVRMPIEEDQRGRLAAVVDRIFGLGPSERTLIPAPMYHTAPNIYALTAIARGMDVTIMSRFDAEEFLTLIERHRITTVQVVPTMFVRLLALPPEVRERYDLSSLRWVVHAAAPCPPHVKRAMIDWLGPILAEYYGGTESGPITFCTTEEWLAHPGTVGRPLEGATVRVLGPGGAELPPGESGDVYMWLGAWPDFKYNGDPGKRASIDRDGLVTCGDIGYLDDDGYLYLNDRRADTVISGGVNIFPAEIENCLLGLAGVCDCAVFGVPDDEFGEALAVHIEGSHDLTDDQVRDYLSARLAGYKVPRIIKFSEKLPRDDTGKLFKRLLREPYWTSHNRRI